MTEIARLYADLVSRYLASEIDAGEFERVFVEQFKRDEEFAPEPVFLCLDQISGALEVWTDDPELLEKGSDFYINEAQLRVEADAILKSLLAIAGTN